MQCAQVQGGFLLKLQRGEKVLETVTAFCDEQGIKGAWLNAVGAVCKTELGYYDATKREYVFHSIPETREVVSFSGNVAQKDSISFAHVHGVLSAGDPSLSCQGGHIKETEVALTLEVFLQPLGVDLRRAFDEDTGLFLLQM